MCGNTIRELNMGSRIDWPRSALSVSAFLAVLIIIKSQSHYMILAYVK